MTALVWLPALGAPLLLGFFLVSSLTGGGVLLRASLGAAAGLGLTGWLMVLFLVLGGGGGFGFAWLELALLAGLAWLRFTTGREADRFPEPGPWTRQDALLCLILVVTAAAGAYLFVLFTLDKPHGDFDAWWHWNARARFIFRGGGHWTDYFSTFDKYYYIRDYPMMLPALVARLWRWLGSETLLGPSLIAFLFTAAAATLLYSGVAAFRGRSQALLAVILLTGVPNFAKIGSYQIGDMPLSLFILSSLVALRLIDRREAAPRRLAALAGIMTGLTCWAKNEGLVFLFAVILARAVVLAGRRRWRSLVDEALFFSLGLAPVLAALIYFKLTYAWANVHLVGLSPADILTRLTDLGRHWIVIGHLAQVLTPLLVLAVYLALLGPRPGAWRRPGIMTGWLALLFTLAGYYAVYLIQDPDWLEFRLINSKERLMMHLWPATLFIYFQIVNEPVLGLSAEPEPA